MRRTALLAVLAFPLSLCAQSSSLAPHPELAVPPDSGRQGVAAPDTSLTAWLERYMARMSNIPHEELRGAAPTAWRQPDTEIAPRIQWLRPNPAVDPEMWIKPSEDIDPKILMGGDLPRPWRPDRQK